jgi:transposase
MPPAYVKPYVKRGKTDAADAEAICEAVTRPTMRFVAVKSREQQGVLMLAQDAGPSRPSADRPDQCTPCPLGRIWGCYDHWSRWCERPSRNCCMKSRTSCLSTPDLLSPRSSPSLRHSNDRSITWRRKSSSWHRADETSRRLATIPGIGPITASAIAAAVPDPGQFQSGRQFAAWLGLTPRPNSSGGKDRLGGISKQGDGYLRRLLVVGATAVVRMVRKDPSRQPWLAALLERKTVRVATVGLANKTARIAWAVMTRKEVYAA